MRRDVSFGTGIVDSPLGPLWIAVGPRGLAALAFGAKADRRALQRIKRVYDAEVVPNHRRIAPIERELDQYFTGRRKAFDIEVDLMGLTEFQRRVLAATARVPYGTLISYRQVAGRAGNALAARAAGGALGANPIPIVIPCHRIVASDGGLGGYSGGMRIKQRLLALEGAA